MKKELDVMKKVSSASIIKQGQYSLNSNVLQLVEKKNLMKKEEETKKLTKAYTQYKKLTDAADIILRSKLRSQWSANDYKTVLKPLKRREDGKMPTTLPELTTAYNSWIYRSRKVFDIEAMNINVNDDDGKDENDDNDALEETEV